MQTSFKKPVSNIRVFLEEYYLFILSVAALLLCWEILVHLFNVPAYIVPSPSRVFNRLFTDLELILKNTAVTVKEILGGFFVGIIGAILLAIIMIHSKILEKVFYPSMVVSQSFPKESLAPLFVIWLGYGILPKIVMAALICFFPVAINSLRGFVSVDPLALDLMRSLSATNRQIFLKLRFPNALPYIFSALKVSVTLSLIGSIVGEFVGASAGLGYLIMLSNSQLQTDLLFAVIFVLAFIGILLFLIIDFCEKRFLYWQELENNLSKEIIVR